MANPIKIKPPVFSKREVKHKGLKDLERILGARLELDMKQYRAYDLKQIDENSEVYCYYHQRTQLLRKYIAEIKELKSKFTTIG